MFGMPLIILYVDVYHLQPLSEVLNLPYRRNGNYWTLLWLITRYKQDHTLNVGEGAHIPYCCRTLLLVLNLNIISLMMQICLSKFNIFLISGCNSLFCFINKHTEHLEHFVSIKSVLVYFFAFYCLVLNFWKWVYLNHENKF